MRMLVVGATGATGRHLVRSLLQRGAQVRAVARSRERIPEDVRDHPRLEVVEASLLDLDDTAMAALVADCDAVGSCLGHNLTFQGIYGQPRRLVTDAVRRLCEAAEPQARARPLRFVLMNTAGNQNRDLDEPLGLGERVALGVVRALLPPHTDNEAAADYLRTTIGPESDAIEWVVVRPDTLTDAPDATPYELHASPTRSALFNPGQSSRVNVGTCMAELVDDEALWARWRGQMPVLYNVA